MPTAPYGNPSTAQLLLVGHDPRLQRSDTIASFALFADYYFRPKPTAPAEARKYGLAASAFAMVEVLSGGVCAPGNVCVTNLCNDLLPAAPRGHTVLIPEHKAREGIAHLHDLIRGSSIRVVVAMSQQVNLWLHTLDFCTQDAAFVAAAAPQPAGLEHLPPYYQPRAERAFPAVCGRHFGGPRGIPVVPVVHVKNWPLRGKFVAAYSHPMDNARAVVQRALQGVAA